LKYFSRAFGAAGTAAMGAFGFAAIKAAGNMEALKMGLSIFWATSQPCERTQPRSSSWPIGTTWATGA
jgi:hypothetical protein